MEKICWICRRTEKELLTELNDVMDAVGFDETDKKKQCFEKSNILGEQKVNICIGCSSIIYNFIHDRSKGIDEFTVVELQDIEFMKTELIETIEKLGLG